MQHRNDQTPIGANRHANMIVIFINNVFAVNFGIYGRHIFQRLDAGFDEEAHEAQFNAMLFFKHIFELIAHGHYFCHVHFIESRQHGSGVLRIFQSARDGLAKPRHLHAFFTARSDRC